MTESNNTLSISSLKSKWQSWLIISTIIAIVIHLIIQYSRICSSCLKYPQLSHIANSNYSITAANLPLLLIIIFAGIPLIAKIIIKASQLNLGADILAALSVVVAAYLQEYLAANIIILMMLSGQMLEVYAVDKASFVLMELAKRMPSVAHRKTSSATEEIAIQDIAIGDLIVVYPHETCPVDGTVIEGDGSMNEAYLTGEPYQIDKAPGSAALSGAINGNSMLLICADKKSSDSRYAKIMQVMQEAQQHRPALRRMGDQIGIIFVVLALLVAGATFYFTGSSLRFLAVLA